MHDKTGDDTVEQNSPQSEAVFILSFTKCKPLYGKAFLCLSNLTLRRDFSSECLMISEFLAVAPSLLIQTLLVGQIKALRNESHEDSESLVQWQATATVTCDDRVT